MAKVLHTATDGNRVTFHWDAAPTALERERAEATFTPPASRANQGVTIQVSIRRGPSFTHLTFRG